MGDAVAVRLRPLLARQGRAFGALSDVAVVRWADLNGAEQARLRTWATDQLLPFLTPKALTRAPGHPFPLVGDRRIALLVALRDHAGSPVHYAHVEVPEALDEATLKATITLTARLKCATRSAE